MEELTAAFVAKAPQLLQDKCASAAKGRGEAESASGASTDPPAGGGAWSITPPRGSPTADASRGAPKP